MTDIVTTILTSITGFVSGMASTFVSAFKSIFLETSGSTTTISDLGKFLLIMFGISLGYGVIRFVTGLLRRRG